MIRKTSARVDLTEGILSLPGTGMKSAENFKILEELADVLGAAVGPAEPVDENGSNPNTRLASLGRLFLPTCTLHAVFLEPSSIWQG